MQTLEKHAPGLDFQRIGLPVQVTLIESEPDDSSLTGHGQPRWEERFWNPLVQAHQSEEEVWKFLGNWDL
jgi:hypothetical protein